MTLFVRDLAVDARIGIHPHERLAAQPLLVSIEIDVAPPRADSIAETLDYDCAADAVRQVIARGHIETVEHCARAVGDLLILLPRVRSVCVRVEKPRAIAGAAGAGAVWRESRA